jgi:cell wall-associated NlpC family hydrolase
MSPSPKLTQWHWWPAGLLPSSVARRPRQPPNLMAEGREFASPIMGGAAGDTPRIRTTRTCARNSNPSTMIGTRSANNHQGHAVATDREHTAGQMTTTTKCRNVEKIHGGGVIHRCTGVGSAISRFSLHFDCSGYAGCCSDLQRPGELHWIHLAGIPRASGGSIAA